MQADDDNDFWLLVEAFEAVGARAPIPMLRAFEMLGRLRAARRAKVECRPSLPPARAAIHLNGVRL